MSTKQSPILAKKSRNAVERKALIKLHITKSLLSAGREPTAPPTMGLKVPLGYPVEKMPRKVREVVRRRVLTEKAVKRAIRGREEEVKVATSLSIPGVPWMTMPLDGGLRVLEVGDVFGERGGVGEVDAYVDVNLEPRQGAGEGVRKGKGKGGLRCLRIGYMPIKEAGDPGFREKRRDGRLLGPAYCWPLLVWFDDDLKTVKFTKIHAFDFDDVCIGDPTEDETWNQVKYRSICGGFYTGLFMPFQREGWSFAKFKKVLRQHIDEDWGNLGKGMPVLLPYCFNKYDPAEHNLGLKGFPKDGIEVAVRCVNYYEADGQLKNLSFHRDIRLVIKREDTLDDIREFLYDEINARETEDGVKIDSAKLFTDQHRDNWEWELWVLPQRIEPKKLYRFTEGRVSQFVKPKNLPIKRKLEQKLFMGAHVVPRT